MPVYASTVTVVIVNWNSGSLLAGCLRHLDAQTFRPQRVLVIDNASTDGSLEAIHGHAGVEIIRADGNLGFAAANNRAFDCCDTEFVALLNPDAFPEPDWLARLLAAALAHPSVAAFGSRQLKHAEEGVLDGIGDCYHVSGLVWRAAHGEREQPMHREAREIFSPCAAAALYRRQAVLGVGGFDEAFFCYVEDVDLGFRLRLAGYGARYVPDAVVRHIGSATTGSANSAFSVYHGHRNLVWTFVKNMPGPLFWALVPLHVLLNIAEIVVFFWRGQGLTILKAKRDALRGLSIMWERRRRIQQMRKTSLRDIWRHLDKRLGRGASRW